MSKRLLTAAEVARIERSLVVPKLSDQAVNNSTALVNDTELVIPVIASARYFVKMFLDIAALSTVADFKWSWTVPAGGSFKGGRASSFAGVNTGAASTPPALDTTGAAAVGTDNLEFGLILYYWFTTVAAGNIVFRFAQSTAAAENTTLKAGSLAEVLRLSP